MITIKSNLSLRKVLSDLMADTNTSMKEMCTNTVQGYPNMSRYLSGQRNIYADNLEKALNYCLQKKSATPPPDEHTPSPSPSSEGRRTSSP